MAKITGRVTLKIDGSTLLSKRGATLDFGGVKRTAVVGANQVNGYSEEIAAPTVECTVSHTAATSLQKLADIVDSSLVFATDSGHIYVLSGAFLTDTPQLSESEGDLKLSFSAITCDET